jgi:DNA-binding transcriptional MerR regulator
VKYSKTMGEIRDATGLAGNTLRLYCDLGLIPCHRLANGMRLFAPDAVEKAKQVFAQRMARKGKWRAERAAKAAAGV